MSRWPLFVALAALSACALESQGTGDPGVGGVGGVGGTAGSIADASAGGFAGVGASGGFGGGDDDAGAVLPYGYRRRIHIEVPSSGLPAGLTLSFELDHGALVAAGKSKADGSDVRVFRRDGASLVESNALQPWERAGLRRCKWSSLWRRRPRRRQTTATTSTTATRKPPPLAKTAAKIYLFWDDFEDGVLDAGWTLSKIGSASGSVNEDAGKLHLEAQGNDIWDTADDFVLLSREQSGDFVADCLVTASGGALGNWAKVGGVMLRQSVDASSQNRIASPVNGAKAFTNSYRLTPGGSTDEQTVAGPNPIPELARITRRGDISRAWHSADGVSWEQVGSAVTFAGLADPVRVGIPLANRDTGSLGWVDVEWFRVRRLAASPPVVTLDPEEPGPFSG